MGVSRADAPGENPACHLSLPAFENAIVAFAQRTRNVGVDKVAWTERLLVTLMEVRFTPEQEAQLSQIAAHAGIDAEHLVKNAALRLMEDNTAFRAAVQEGIAAGNRGEFVEHEEVWANVEEILRS